MLTPLQIIDVAKISEYLAVSDIKQKGLYGGGQDLKLPRKLYNIRKSVEWQYDKNPPIDAVNAIGVITINATGNNGNNITVKVLDPVFGLITLGSYSKVSGDTDTTILATHIAAALNINIYGYAVSGLINAVNITARNGLGASINGGTNLQVSATTHAETKAKAFFTPTRVSTGTVFNITVIDPNLGSIQVGSYTQQSTDTTDTIFISNLVQAITLDGYTGITSGSFGMYVIAAAGLGASINGNVSQIVWMGGFNSANFSGGVNGFGLIPNTLTQFSGGVTGVPPTQDLVATSNYLYSLCAPYNLQAINILTQGGGGSISPIVPPFVNIPPIEFIVSDSSPIANGGNSLYIPQYKGYNIIFNRGGVPQTQVVQSDNSYFSWNPVTAMFYCFGNAVTSELFSINATI